MAESKPSRSKTRLSVLRAKAADKLAEQVTAGKELLSRPILSGEHGAEIGHFLVDVAVWHDVNHVLMANLFDQDEYAREYEAIEADARNRALQDAAAHGGLTPFGEYGLERDILKSSFARINALHRSIEFMDETVPEKGAGPDGPALDARTVFVVHGHDAAVKESVARVLERLDLKPVILHEQPNLGRTVIEKFEAYSSAVYAVVLLTPDDIGAAADAYAKDPKSVQGRARQNVILELGYFIGRLGRKRVSVIYRESVEQPSDILGMLYIRYGDDRNWQIELAQELRAAGVEIDLNKLILP